MEVVFNFHPDLIPPQAVPACGGKGSPGGVLTYISKAPVERPTLDMMSTHYARGYDGGGEGS